MKKILLLFAVLSLSQISIAQEIKNIEEKGKIIDEVFMSVEVMPRFMGCADNDCTQMKLMKYIAENTKYPLKAKKNNITGSVFVSFVVGKSGNINNVKIIRGVDKYLDAEAARVVQSLPNFKPGKQRGKPVNVQYIVPIKFIL